MKFDVLYGFRDWLNQRPELAKNTKKTYYQSVKNVLAQADFNDVSDIAAATIESGISAQKTRKDVSAAKRGFELFAEFAPRLELPDSLDGISKQKRNYRKRRFKPLYFKKVQHTINGIQNEKFRLGYRIMMATGARVSEVAQIRKRDITLNEDGSEIKIHIEHTKSGGAAELQCNDPYLLEKLPAFVAGAGCQDDGKVFYSAGAMINMAVEYGFQCHDLRRVYSKLKYKEIKKLRPDLSPGEVVEEVRPLMRHGSSRTTKRYLGRKIIW